MKPQLHYLFVLLCTLFCSVTGHSQINYTQNFNANATGWDDWDFARTTTNACEGYSFRGNFYYINDPDFGEFDYTPYTTSPSLGTSNGLPVTLTYSYKLINYTGGTAVTNTPDWGNVTVEYATTIDGPWTLLQTITPANHLSSASCATKTITFTPPAGTGVVLKITGNPTVGGADVDVWLYLDDISAIQQLPGCSAAPAASTTVAANASICNQQNASLSLSPAYTVAYDYQWLKSTDGTNYTPISGATSATLSTPQTVNTWYKANVTCTATSATTTSTPVQVTNTGLNCLCSIAFSSGVEPITNVTFASINNTTSPTVNGTPSLENFAGSIAPALVNKGTTYPISLKGNTDGTIYTNYFKVYIDFNQNGNLDDTGESFQIGSITASTGTDAIAATGNILIPATALTGTTYMRVIKLFSAVADGYPTTPCPTVGQYGFGQAEDYLLNIQPCSTVPPVAEANQSVCAGATLASIAVTGTSVKWYSAETGGTLLQATQAVVSGTTYYASSTAGCESPTRTAVTVTISSPIADEPADVLTCESYVLPALTNGAYYTQPGGQGTMLATGDVISADAILYVYNAVGACAAEHSFTVTIEAFEVDQPDDVTACSEYILPQLTSGNYYTGASGLGEALSAGDAITETMTIHVYGVSSVNPACTADNAFTVTVISVEVDEMDDVETCSAYVLPAISPNNQYYTGPGGTGAMLTAGTVVTGTQVIYIYATGGDSMQCNAESSFMVTITEIEEPEVDEEIVYELDLTGGLFLNQIEVTAEGTLTWYATEEDAENGVNPIPSDTVVPVGTTTYYVTQTVGECESDPAEVTITVVLGTEDFDMTAFSYYPNPVSDVLNLNYSENITAVEVLNLVGQKVISGQYNSNTVQLNLSQLASGTYLVKVSTENASKTIKVVKNK